MSRTQIIAHRGASGYLPEHTIAAKCLAYGLGADFLEQDVIATRDHALIVLHDLCLDEVSDVAARYPGRQRRDGHYYAFDFDLDELRELRLAERRDPGSEALVFPGRFDRPLDGLRIMTLTEEIDLVESLNRSTGRNVGIYPEIKDPEWHLAQGFDLTSAVTAALVARGLGDERANVYLQCFSRAALEQVVSDGQCSTRRILLLESPDVREIDQQSDGWRQVAELVTGVGLPYQTLLNDDVRRVPVSSGLAARLRTAGLEIHPYTLRRDEPPKADFSFEELLGFLIHDTCVDALFADQPDIALRVRDLAD